jgi:hypothetical protein
MTVEHDGAMRSCIEHNGIGEKREVEIRRCLFFTNGCVNWEHFNIIDQYSGEDDIHYAVSILIKENIFNEKEGYAIYQGKKLLTPTERFFGEKLFFTSEKYVMDFTESKKINGIHAEHVPSMTENYINIVKKFPLISKLF